MSGSHIVEAGDTLFGIAKKYELKLDDLVKWNNIEDPSKVKIGQKIELSGHDAAPPPPPPPPPSPEGEAYVVEPGDTFSAIGKKFGIDYKLIMEVNGYEDPTKLLAGSTITIPSRSHTVVAGDTFSALGKKYGVDYKKIMEVNGYEDPTKLPVGVELTIPYS